MSERGEFLLKDTRPLKEDRHPRPGILPSYAEDRVAPALDPLAGVDPPGVDPVQWRDAVARTRALLLDVTAARTISTLRMQDLRREFDRAVARAGPVPNRPSSSWPPCGTPSTDPANPSSRPERRDARLARPEIFPAASRPTGPRSDPPAREACAECMGQRR